MLFRRIESSKTAGKNRGRDRTSRDRWRRRGREGPDWSCVMLSVLPGLCECDVGLVEVWSR